MLSTINRIDTSQPKRTLTNKETPVTPPSKKLLGNRKAFKPNPAQPTPKEIQIASRKYLLMLIGFNDQLFPNQTSSTQTLFR